ncbi:unnamed protein product [Moneuplotes crassus]|uniref:Uncharacterized protein n=1 Tax=Euplotes crassus TaxID=5936 RepID=A0AAD1UTX4_EUPCR|nr:unnamed protein product [Moneuplotes crassus]
MKTNCTIISSNKIFIPTQNEAVDENIRAKPKELDSLISHPAQTQLALSPKPKSPNLSCYSKLSKPLKKPVECVQSSVSAPIPIKSQISVASQTTQKIDTNKEGPKALRTIQKRLNLLTKSCLSSAPVKNPFITPWLSLIDQSELAYLIGPFQNQSQIGKFQKSELHCLLASLVDLRTYVNKAVTSEPKSEGPNKRFKYEVKEGNQLVEKEIEVSNQASDKLKTKVANQKEQLTLQNGIITKYKTEVAALKDKVKALENANKRLMSNTKERGSSKPDVKMDGCQ